MMFKEIKIVSMFIGIVALFTAQHLCADNTITRMFDVRTPMRDGVTLSSNVWLPVYRGAQ